MDQYITITSKNQNPCEFVSNFTDAVNLSDGYEVAVTQIFHAPVDNITPRNNKFTLIKGAETEDYRIPTGYYGNTCQIIRAIKKALSGPIFKVYIDSFGPHSRGSQDADELFLKKQPSFAYKQGGESSSLRLLEDGVFFSIDNKRDNNEFLLKSLEYCIDGNTNRLDIIHFELDTSTETGFLYSNIVGNSIINQQQSRLLAIIPISSKKGYNCHEFTNPDYKPLSVHSFTDIAFTLTNVRGEVMSMDHDNSLHRVSTVMYPTIITLHIRKIYK